MRIRITVLLLSVCLILVSVPALAESHSEGWLDNWAGEIYNEALKQPVTSDQPDIPLEGKMILAVLGLDGKCGTCDKYSMMAKNDPHPDDPFFQPVLSNGQPKYTSIPASCWANTVEECEWLILYGGFETGRNKGFYGGNIDRVIVTTRVYVVDPKEKRIVMEETIGTDTPGIKTKNPKGQVLYDEAEKFIIRLVTGEQ